jgi:hypothetical protein
MRETVPEAAVRVRRDSEWGKRMRMRIKTVLFLWLEYSEVW